MLVLAPTGDYDGAGQSSRQGRIRRSDRAGPEALPPVARLDYRSALTADERCADAAAAEADAFRCLRLYVAGSITQVDARPRQLNICARNIWPAATRSRSSTWWSVRLWRRSDDILAIPTLVRRLPEPPRKSHRRSFRNTEPSLVGLAFNST